MYGKMQYIPTISEYNIRTVVSAHCFYFGGTVPTVLLCIPLSVGLPPFLLNILTIVIMGEEKGGFL